MKMGPLICLVGILAGSCSRKEVALEDGGKLSADERKSIVAVHPAFASWEPEQSAFWLQHGATWHICIRCGGIGSIGMPYWVFVFDAGGHLTEANIIQAPNPGRAVTVSSIFPLKVAFEAHGNTYACDGEFSQTNWLPGIREIENRTSRNW